MDHVTLTTPFFGVVCHPQASAWRNLLYTKYDNFSRSRDIIGAHNNLNGLRDLTTPVSGMVCHRGLVLATMNLPTKF